jgi:hypothetical protein
MGSRALRDNGLFQIGRATRWMAVGTIFAGGVLSAAVAKALPGHSSHHASQTGPSFGAAAGPSASGATPASTPDPSGAGSSQSGLTVPQQAPQPSTTQPVVSSGGS